MQIITYSKPTCD